MRGVHQLAKADHITGLERGNGLAHVLVLAHRVPRALEHVARKILSNRIKLIHRELAETIDRTVRTDNLQRLLAFAAPLVVL